MVNGAGFGQATNLPCLNVKSNPRQMADVCRTFILQQIKLEKNGFHSFVDLWIGFKAADF